MEANQQDGGTDRLDAGFAKAGAQRRPPDGGSRIPLGRRDTAEDTGQRGVPRYPKRRLESTGNKP